MSGKIFGLVALTALVVLAPQAEARRVYWWETQPRQYDTVDPSDPGDGSYAPYVDSQDSSAADMFNQDQYDRYVYETRRRHRMNRNGERYDPPAYDQSYDGGMADPADPQYNDLKPKPAKPKKPKTVKAATVAKTGVDSTTTVTTTTGMIKPPATSTASVETKPSDAQTGETKTVVAAAKPAKPVKGGKVTCAKGEEIVASYGFLDISQKSCEGSSLVYSAVRGKSNFEVEVSSSSGEVLAVRKVS
jgi:hypothetical protein